MTTKKREFKAFRLEDSYISMLEKIRAYENSKPTYNEKRKDMSEREVVEKAIELLYLKTFGDNVMDDIMPLIWSEVSNRAAMMLEPLFQKVAKNIREVYFEEMVNREMIAILTRQAGFNIDALEKDNNLFELLLDNDIMLDEFEIVERDKRLLKIRK